MTNFESVMVKIWKWTLMETSVGRRFPFCEVCGKSSVVMVRDMMKYANYRKGVYEYTPLGDPHSFCGEHERKPDVIEMGN